MIKPILRISLAVQLRRLDIYILVLRVEIDVLDRCGTAGLRVRDADGGEVWGRDEAGYVSGGKCRVGGRERE
jgi:hypothetical protein